MESHRNANDGALCTSVAEQKEGRGFFAVAVSFEKKFWRLIVLLKLREVRICENAENFHS